MSDIVDFKKNYKQLYSPKPAKPELLKIPKMQFTMIDGEGDPMSRQFQEAVAALYSAVYGLKFARKKAGVEPEFTVGALEGLWWVKSGKIFDIGKREDWLWTL
jgi:hypothetical protein